MSWLDDARVGGVFVDSSAYFAYVARNEPRHSAVNETFYQLASVAVRLITTNIVVAETHALVLGRIGRLPAMALLEEIDQSQLTTVMRVTVADDIRARQIIRR